MHKVVSICPNLKLNVEGMPILGLGTIGTGRRWPMTNKSWKMPLEQDVFDYYQHAAMAGIRMWDTAPAYGLAEERMGAFLKQFPRVAEQVVIATKWGEEFDLTSETSQMDNSVFHLRKSVERSGKYLPRIDILYFHNPTVPVLSDPDIREEYARLSAENKIRYSGVSVSDPDLLQNLLSKDLLWTTYLQVPSRLIWNHEPLVQKAHRKGLVIVVNSPSRGKPVGMSNPDAYRALAEKAYVSFILTGSRTHFLETLGYFDRSIQSESKA